MKSIDILHLYPNELNTYGDHGNGLTLKRRLQWHGFEANFHYHHPGSKLPDNVDIVIGGGGQDSAQSNVQTDILRIGQQLHQLAEAHIPMLLICGTYQLFCHRFITHSREEIKGIGLIEAETIAGAKRMIGNVMVDSEYGKLFGFENHSGQTFLASGQAALGKVIRGGGNNGQDKTEGARTNNVFGTYLHGPILPNNPVFCDELIKLAVKKRYGEFKPANIDDSLVQLARSSAQSRHY